MATGGVPARFGTTLSGILLFLAVCAAAAVIAAAASLAVSSVSLGASTVATPRCTAAGLSVIQNLSALTVASVTVSGLPAACGTATVQVTLNNGATNTSGSASVPAGGGSVTVPLAVPPAVTGVEQTDLVLIGP